MSSSESSTSSKHLSSDNEAITALLENVDQSTITQKTMQDVVVINKKLKKLNEAELKSILGKFSSEQLCLGFYPFLGTDKVTLLFSTEKKGVIDLLGLPGALLTAYKLHGVLLTAPQDWWNAIIQCISYQVNFEHYSRQNELSSLLKEEDINCDISDMSPHSWLPMLLKEMNESMKVYQDPEEKECFTEHCLQDFTTSNVISKIVNLNSVVSGNKFRFLPRVAQQQSFLCGLYGIKMLGSLDDWKRLVQKFEGLNHYLERSHEQYGIEKPWRDKILEIFRMLHITYKYKNRHSGVKAFWRRMVTRDGSDCVNELPLTGWLAYLFSAKTVIDAVRLDKIPQDFNISTTPVDVAFNKKRVNRFILASGIIGYEMYHDKKSERWFIEPLHDYALFQVKDS